MSHRRRNAALNTNDAHTTRPARAAGKLAIIMAAVALLVIALGAAVSERDLEVLKHRLSLWTLIALVIIINLVSFACFIAMAAAWQWVRQDLKAPRDDGLDG